MYLPCMVLGSLTGISVNLLIIIMGVIAIIYSYTGGLKSVLWTDFIQGSVLLIGDNICPSLPSCASGWRFWRDCARIYG